MKSNKTWARARGGESLAASRKTGITIRIDDDLLDYFVKDADAPGGAVGYQIRLNQARREHVKGRALKFEDALRGILEEEIRAAG